MEEIGLTDPQAEGLRTSMKTRIDDLNTSWRSDRPAELSKAYAGLCGMVPPGDVEETFLGEMLARTTMPELYHAQSAMYRFYCQVFTPPASWTSTWRSFNVQTRRSVAISLARFRIATSVAAVYEDEHPLRSFYEDGEAKLNSACEWYFSALDRDIPIEKIPAYSQEVLETLVDRFGPLPQARPSKQTSFPYGYQACTACSLKLVHTNVILAEGTESTTCLQCGAIVKRRPGLFNIIY